MADYDKKVEENRKRNEKYIKEFEKTYWFDYYFCSTNNIFVGTEVIFVLNKKWLEV